MAAAVLTASVVSKRNLVHDAITGTAPREVEYYLEATKATQNDWILLEDAIGSTTGVLQDVTGIVLDGSDDLTQESFTYDDSADKLVLTAAGTGTVKIHVRMKYA